MLSDLRRSDYQKNILHLIFAPILGNIYMVGKYARHQIIIIKPRKYA